ncbi:hypothetical protein HHK36_012673 [Tetracentron sinense]|uniref:Cupin type-1 domain-containing protein n=1 Tax=Tetracentron sinense TaxID=13715 RepID=A0A834Z8Q5_TETSI|nr:hypothetical protein HHK36_012673 [Tetracentron sinense]
MKTQSKNSVNACNSANTNRGLKSNNNVSNVAKSDLENNRERKDEEAETPKTHNRSSNNASDDAMNKNKASNNVSDAAKSDTNSSRESMEEVEIAETLKTHRGSFNNASDDANSNNKVSNNASNVAKSDTKSSRESRDDVGLAEILKNLDENTSNASDDAESNNKASNNACNVAKSDTKSNRERSKEVEVAEIGRTHNGNTSNANSDAKRRSEDRRSSSNAREGVRSNTESNRENMVVEVVKEIRKVKAMKRNRRTIRMSSMNKDLLRDSGPKKDILGLLRGSPRGRGTISLVRQDNRESFNLQKGDVIRVPSGTTVYLINKDSNEKLHVAKLFKPVNTPGYYKEYYGIGGENPESFFRVFSNEILEAAFNTPNEKLQRLFGQQRKGVIIRASQEQIRALTQHVSSEGDRHGPYNLLNKRPKHSNNYGKLFEVTPNDYQELQDLDVSVAFTNISQGAMMAPFYNTRSTKVVLVDGGNGYFEMACPHLASQRQGPPQGGEEQEQEQEQEGGVHYQKVRSRLSPQTVFVIPAGHPVAIVASQNENLQLVVFGINAKDNQRNFLAGRENVMNQVEREAKELAFNIPGREIEQIFKNQGQSYFLPGPHQRQQREEGHGPLEAILDFVGF